MHTSPESLFETKIESLPLFYKGKVRDIYEIDADHFLIITTDRLSAFDVILPDPIPGKGKVLTSVSNFWFKKLKHVIPNHLTDQNLKDLLPKKEFDQVNGRAIVVKKLKPLPVEAIVRGYLIGSGWKDYQNSGAVCGIKLATGLKQAQQLPKPIFTPSSKAAVGDHDENINYEKTIELIGADKASQVKEVSLQLYKKAAEYALEKGIIIADTKFEFGVDESDNLFLIDEALTPDSSRFWPADTYEVSISPPSYDKQIVRDYLETLDWDKTPPGPKLPEEILKKTSDKYQEVERKLT